MSVPPDFAAIADEIAETSRWLYRRGWCPATSSNFSARLADGTLAITVSGRDKETLTAADVLHADADGRPLHPADARPSAETHLHVRLYRRDVRIGAILHTHSPASTLLSRLAVEAGREHLTIAGWELLKALDGVTTHAHTEQLPVVPNSQDMTAIADAVEPLLGEGNHAYLVAGHGLTTWGRTLGDARRHAEALEFLLDLERTRLLMGRFA